MKNAGIIGALAGLCAVGLAVGAKLGHEVGDGAIHSKLLSRGSLREVIGSRLLPVKAESLGEDEPKGIIDALVVDALHSIEDPCLVHFVLCEPHLGQQPRS